MRFTMNPPIGFRPVNIFQINDTCLGPAIASSIGMSLSRMISLLPALNWIAGRRRALKLEKLQRRLLEWNHEEDLPKLNPDRNRKTLPSTTC